jgi:hypothetical protein
LNILYDTRHDPLEYSLERSMYSYFFSIYISLTVFTSFTALITTLDSGVKSQSRARLPHSCNISLDVVIQLGLFLCKFFCYILTLRLLRFQLQDRSCKLKDFVLCFSVLSNCKLIIRINIRNTIKSDVQQDPFPHHHLLPQLLD